MLVNKFAVSKFVFTFRNCFEGDDGKGGTGDGKGGAGDGKGGAGDGKGGAGEPKTFTQEQLNAALAEDRRKHVAKNQELIGQLEALKSAKGLSDQQITDLNNRIEELQTQHMSKEDIAKRETEKLTKQHNEKLSTAEATSKAWEKRYSDSVIATAITTASVRYNAINPEQIISLVQPKTKIVETKDELGQLTGNYEARVAWKTVDKEGKTITLDLSVDEAVKRMVEDTDNYGNLFKSGENSGTGGSNNGRGSSSGVVDETALTNMSMEQYAAHRKKNPDMFK